ncbi:MAG: DinB family protein [Flavobacteriales bacterium]|nr:DinB family protein [Flavobacteriales bacterium]
MNILAATHHTLKNLTLFLQQIEAENYRQPLLVFNGSSLGEHTRHILEFYQCLFSQQEQHFINYDRRERSRSLQQEPEIAIHVIHQILNMLDSVDLNKQLQLVVAYDTQNDATDNMPTNLKREITYCLEHAIHHMALIKIGVLTNFPHIVLSDDFGIAPSTIKHQQRVCVQ